MPDTVTPQTQILDYVRSLHTLLEKTAAGVRTERALLADIAQMKQEQVKVNGKLEAAVATISDKDRKIAELQREKEHKLQEVERSRAEASALRSEPKIDPDTPQRLLESRTQNDVLGAQISKLEGMIEEKTSQAQRQEGLVGKLGQEAAQLKEALQKSEEKVTSLVTVSKSHETMANKRIEEMREIVQKDIEYERSQVKNELSELSLQHEREKNELIMKASLQTDEGARARDALLAARASEKQLKTEIKELQRARSKQEASDSNRIKELKTKHEALSSANCVLQDRIKAEEAKHSTLLQRLNERIWPATGVNQESVSAAVDFILSHTAPCPASDQTQTTTDSFHTAQSQLTANTAAFRATSRGSENTEGAVDNAIDLLMRVNTPQRPEEQRQRAGQRAEERPQELPHADVTSRSGKDAELSKEDRATGLPEAIVQEPRLGEKDRGGGQALDYQRRDERAGDDLQEQSMQHESAISQTLGNKQASQNQETMANFRTAVFESEQGRWQMHLAVASSKNILATTPATPTKSSQHDNPGKPPSNSSARRLSMSEALRRSPRRILRPTSVQRGQDTKSTARVSFKDVNEAQVNKIRSTGDESNSNAQVTGSVEDATMPLNRFASAPEIAARGILKRKAEDGPQTSRAGAPRNRQTRVSTQGLGPIVDYSRSSKGQNKSQYGARNGRPTKARQQGEQDSWLHRVV